MDAGDLEAAVNPDEEVGFLPAPKSKMGNNVSNEDSFGRLLTREDLLRLDSEEPVWRRVRIGLMIGFWVLWLGLLAASVVVIVLTPKCPPRPNLSFWQNKVGYWLDPFSFADSDGNGIGDVQGIVAQLSYIKEVVGAGFVVLGSVVSGHYTNEFTSLGIVQNFSALDPALGTMADFRSFVKTFHRNGLEVVITLDFNSISVTHDWAKTPGFLKAPLPFDAVRRDGSPATVQVGGRAYYSVGAKNTVDLDLTSQEVIDAVKNVTEFWLREGVDGIMLSNAAFYVEEADYPGVTSPALVSTNGTNEWFKRYPSAQLFTNGSVQFVTQLRTFIDSISISSGRARLLAVDPGNYGYGLDDALDKATGFLGTEEHPAAHMVVSRQFVKHRGWKSQPQIASWQDITVSSYGTTSGDAKFNLGLTTATPSDQRHNDIGSLSAVFLLPGTALLYYGSELGIQLLPSLDPPTDLYPARKVPFPNLSERDSELVCQLPMPWDRSGEGFSPTSNTSTFANYLEKYDIAETVDSALSVGRGDNSFKMVQKLIQLREKPSLKWGTFELLKAGEQASPQDLEIFTRKATGFPAFIVVILKRAPNYGGTFSFASVCDRVIPRLIYPSRPALQLDQPIDSNRIYLQTFNEPAVYVFECA